MHVKVLHDVTHILSLPWPETTSHETPTSSSARHLDFQIVRAQQDTCVVLAVSWSMAGCGLLPLSCFLRSSSMLFTMRSCFSRLSRIFISAAVLDSMRPNAPV